MGRNSGDFRYRFTERALAADFVQSVVVADDFINTYTFDGLNRMISVVQDNQTGGSANAVADKRVELKYNALGQFTSIERNQNTSATYPSLRTAFTYDAGNRLSSIAHRNYTDASTSSLLSDYAFTHDNISRITAINSSLDGNSAFNYDKTHQVTAADHATGRTDESYSYDANGNRTNSGYTTGTNNRTTSDGTYNYEYDKEGNRTKRTLISSGAYEVYTWDQRNRLTKVDFKTSGGSVTKWVEYTYDVFNRLIRRKLDADGSGGGAATNTFYVGYDGISPTLEFDGTTKDDVSHRYLWGSAFDQLFADEQVTVTSSDGNTLWALADHLGTIRDIADYDSGTSTFSITNHRVYDTFGRLESETNSAIDLSFGYTGKQFDDATSLNNYLNRWYDSRIGKWLSEDPIGFAAGDANLSRYVGNTTTMFTDPLGLAAFAEDGSALITSDPPIQETQEDSSGQQDDDPLITKITIIKDPKTGDHFVQTEDGMLTKIPNIEVRPPGYPTIGARPETAYERASRTVRRRGGPDFEDGIIALEKRWEIGNTKTGDIWLKTDFDERVQDQMREDAYSAAPRYFRAFGPGSPTNAFDLIAAFGAAKGGRVPGITPNTPKINPADLPLINRPVATSTIAPNPYPRFPGFDPGHPILPRGFIWKGKPGSTPGGPEGNFINKKTGEYFRPDLTHAPPIEPHWDYRDPGGKTWRIFWTDRMEPKK